MARKVTTFTNPLNAGQGINQLIDLLTKYGDDVLDVIEEASHEVGKEGLKKIKANVRKDFKKGKGRKHYITGWRTKTTRKNFYHINTTIYQTNKPGLTHLLENGHAKADGTGRVPGRPHIEPVNEWAQEEVMKRIEEGIMKL